MSVPCPWPSKTPEERDAEMVALGFMTEEERIRRAYRRIHQEALDRSFFRRVRP